MKITIEFRRRPQADETIEDRHSKVIAGLMSVDPPWGLRGRETITAPPIGDDLQVEVDLTPHLHAGIKASLSYVFRSASYLRDEGQYDDCFFVECDTDTADYQAVVTSAFPEYVKAFAPYRATIVVDEDLALDEWERAVELRKATGRDIDGRDSVLRIGPVNYFDRQLCRRAFNLTPEEVVHALNGRVESAYMLLDGVVIVGSSRPLDRRGLEQLDEALLDALSTRR